MRPSAVLSTVLLLAATTSAWPSMLDNQVDALKREIAPLLVARQDDSSSSASSGDQSSSVEESTGTATGENSSGSRTTASATATPSGDNNNDDNKSSDSEKSTGSAKSSGKQTGSVTSMSGSKTSGTPSNTSMPQFDPRLPAGGASMITPDAMSPASYYKINQMVTFAWNYTSLSKNPQAVDVLATCTQNNAMYTIAANETFEQTQTIVWDTGKYQSTGTIPLLTETYTLIIHDAAKDISATASPGYLGTWKQFTFGMYEPQPYTPIADYVCATCNSAMSLMEKQTYGFLLTMVGVTVLTFGWFTGTAGLW